jgi:hypothetical protein
VAFLCIPYAATSVTIENTKAFTRYVKQHYSAWIDHARNQVGIDRRHSIVMVHGYVKTVEWIVAASQAGSVSRGGSIELEGGMNIVGSVALDYAYELHKKPSMQCRAGPEGRLLSRSPSPGVTSRHDLLADLPSSRDSHIRNPSQSTLDVPLDRTLSRGSSSGRDEMKRDQCIFLRYFQVKWRIPGAYMRIVAGAGPHQLPRDPSPGEDTDTAVVADDNKSGSDIEIDSNVPTQTVGYPGFHITLDTERLCFQPYTWLDILLDYLLQVR